MIYGGYFDPDKVDKKIQELEQQMAEPNFWDDKNNSNKVIKQLNELKTKKDSIESLLLEIKSNIDLLESIKNQYDNEIYELISSEKDRVGKLLDELEVSNLLNGPYDNLDCILEIHPGAGGTESCDWANMLFRMYTRWCDKKNYKYEVVDKEPGEEAGLKSLSMIIYGTNTYGYLKSEKGVHRLIRISPFDSNSRRHTSFASIDITPLFDNDKIDVVIKDEDLRIDVYRSGGNGGQGVNTTDSAVRITHLPTKIVVTCQNERSQIQNKETAMGILKNKLYQLEQEKRNKELSDIKGEYSDINFGSQIRTYTMCPYTLVKDHRTNTEVVNVDKVLDGEIDIFIQDYLKKKD